VAFFDRFLSFSSPSDRSDSADGAASVGVSWVEADTDAPGGSIRSAIRFPFVVSPLSFVVSSLAFFSARLVVFASLEEAPARPIPGGNMLTKASVEEGAVSVVDFEVTSATDGCAGA